LGERVRRGSLRWTAAALRFRDRFVELKEVLHASDFKSLMDALIHATSPRLRPSFCRVTYAQQRPNPSRIASGTSVKSKMSAANVGAQFRLEPKYMASVQRPGKAQDADSFREPEIFNIQRQIGMREMLRE